MRKQDVAQHHGPSARISGEPSAGIVPKVWLFRIVFCDPRVTSLLLPTPSSPDLPCQAESSGRILEGALGQPHSNPRAWLGAVGCLPGWGEPGSGDLSRTAASPSEEIYSVPQRIPFVSVLPAKVAQPLFAERGAWAGLARQDWGQEELPAWRKPIRHLLRGHR